MVVVQITLLYFHRLVKCDLSHKLKFWESIDMAIAEPLCLAQSIKGDESWKPKRIEFQLVRLLPMPKLDDGSFRKANGDMMDPSEVLGAVRNCLEVAHRTVKSGETILGGFLYAKAADGVEALDAWLSDGRYLPDEWKECKPRSFADTKDKADDRCAQCGSTRRTHRRYRMLHDFKEKDAGE